ncbi:helix-turn-helix domain-containing protein [Micromonospora sp. NPDC006766]|uniref:helix-turn-helix domain-containing protein n=1 Tax=Micromonospora sp. NPDC006766 TaxID=3154778 RepID=UPI0033F35C7C
MAADTSRDPPAPFASRPRRADSDALAPIITRIRHLLSVLDTHRSSRRTSHDRSNQYASVRYVVDDVRAAIDFYTTHLGFTLNTSAVPAFADVGLSVYPQLTLSEVARMTGLTRAAARRLLLTLVELGLRRPRPDKADHDCGDQRPGAPPPTRRSCAPS